MASRRRNRRKYAGIVANTKGLLTKNKKALFFRLYWKNRAFIDLGKVVLTKKETVFRLSLWCARRDLNPHVRSEH